ncbi:MAG TPA: alkaline phosphatase D family protein, partial [Planctomycetaceae bacterium]|nr:alkaline phosphatase D family protein [Planctomycetaceae bacterium]
MKALLFTLAVCGLFSLSNPRLDAQLPNCETKLVQAGQGILVGEVTARKALVQVRLTKSDNLVEKDVAGTPGVVEFTLLDAEKNVLATQSVKATPEQDFIARAAFSELKPGQTYHCTTRIGSDTEHLNSGPSASFRTLFGKRVGRRVKFAVVTGMNYAKFHGDPRIDLAQHKIENNTDLPAPYKGPDKHLGYPGLSSILKQQPHFFVGTGDNVYYDTPDKERAQTIPELRQKWHEQFVQPRYRDLFAAVPTYWMIDDHDYRIDDGDNSGDYLPTPAQGRQMMLEQLPVAPHDDDGALTYRTRRINRDLQIWFVENRMYRSPNLSEDGP